MPLFFFFFFLPILIFVTAGHYPGFVRMVGSSLSIRSKTLYVKTLLPSVVFQRAGSLVLSFSFAEALLHVVGCSSLPVSLEMDFRNFLLCYM